MNESQGHRAESKNIDSFISVSLWLIFFSSNHFFAVQVMLC